MQKDEVYHFHQTPEPLCKELVKHIPDLTTEDVVFEPFMGEGNFVRAFPDNQNLITTEIQDGTDYKSIDLETTLIDWVISNPPFRLEEPDGEGATKRVNAFFKLTEYFAGKTNKGVAFLGNSDCLSALTPPRLKKLYEEKNVYIYKIVVCSVKKWRGRYYFIIFKNRFTPEEEHYEIKERFDFFDFIGGSF
tara:strand:+ start:278 stop:850 length:573 start_codon:yes stop_codon:yes gene_type:complete